MSKSQNGWPVYETAPPIAELIPGLLKLRIRPGAVTTIFTDFAEKYHKRVERVDLKVEEEPGHDDWGWALRRIRGSDTVYSNHSSGTAIDLNATRHPRGVKNTFHADLRAELFDILQDYEDPITGREVVRWGGIYTTNVDEMHFEINASPEAVERVATEIKRKKALNPGVPQMELSNQVRLGSSQSKVLSETTDGKLTLEQVYAHLATAGVLTARNTSELAGVTNDLLAAQETTNRLLSSVLVAVNKLTEAFTAAHTETAPTEDTPT